MHLYPKAFTFEHQFSYFYPLTKVHLYLFPSSLSLGIEKCDSRGSETMSKAPHISNCSVASDYLGKL